MKIVLTTLNAKFIHSSLALRYLKAYCAKTFENIVIKEYTINNTLLEILGDIFGERPDIVGLACYIWNIDMTISLANLIKKVLPETVIILGGPEVSYDAAKLAAQHKFIDYVVLGEGEETLYNLLTALQERKSTPHINGLVCRRQDQILQIGGPQVVEQLTCVPFPYTDDDMESLKNKIIYYESSRGCPFACQYCLSSATEGVRFLNLERVYQDLTFFIRHDVKQVKFVDRTFNARKSHFLPLLKFLAAQNCRTNFHFELAIELLDEETLEFLRTVTPGRFQFEVGVQSTYDPALQAVKRKNDWARIVHHVTSIKSYHNIHLHLDLIVGLPYESYFDFSSSFNDVYDLQPELLQIGFLKLLKGSGIRRVSEQHHYVYMDTAPYEVLSNDYLSYEEIRKLKLLEDVFEQTYNSGYFQYTLAWFINRTGNNAFKFYESLTDFWEKNKLQLMAHNVKAVYQILLAFCQYYYPSESSICRDLLKFDALLTGNQVRPEVLLWDGDKWNLQTTRFWRDEARVRKYLPDFQFTNWRNLKKQYHIEVFSFDIPGEYLSYKPVEALFPILFSYEGSTVTYQPIACEDMWPEGVED